jgi:hypothetical protein
VSWNRKTLPPMGPALRHTRVQVSESAAFQFPNNLVLSRTFFSSLNRLQIRTPTACPSLITPAPAQHSQSNSPPTRLSSQSSPTSCDSVSRERVSQKKVVATQTFSLNFNRQRSEKRTQRPPYGKGYRDSALNRWIKISPIFNERSLTIKGKPLIFLIDLALRLMY